MCQSMWNNLPKQTKEKSLPFIYMLLWLKFSPLCFTNLSPENPHVVKIPLTLWQLCISVVFDRVYNFSLKSCLPMATAMPESLVFSASFLTTPV